LAFITKNKLSATYAQRWRGNLQESDI